MYRLLLLFSLLHSALPDHFKPAQNKHPINSLQGIDYIYVINLDTRPEKFALTCKELAPYNITPYRFSAVVGKELTPEQINDIGLVYKKGMRNDIFGTTYRNGHVSHEMVEEEGTTYFCHTLSKGPMGIYLSHLSVINDGYHSGYQTIWIMEDDIEIVRHPSEISLCINELNEKYGPDGWDVLFTDTDFRRNDGGYLKVYNSEARPNIETRHLLPIRRKATKHTFQINMRLGAQSMIWSRRGMKRMLDFAQRYKIFLPYDMDYHLPPGIKMFTTKRDIVTNMLNPISDNS
ncbi:MAG: glycosyltransferase family 25 protein [Simkaniaceae bacterium]|nr:glycosyltransferase family 25 protein [Simkaniaceae bacterium]